METVTKIDEQVKETFELVLKELLAEQQVATKISTDQVAAINQIITTVNSFNQRLENLKIISPPIGTKPIEEIIKNGISEIQSMTENQPKNVTRKFQILLFPEQDAKLFFKIFFGRWFMWLAVMFFTVNLYRFSIHLSNNQKDFDSRFYKYC